MFSLNHSIKSAILLSASILLSGAYIGNQLNKIFNQAYNDTQIVSMEISRINGAIKELSSKEKTVLTYSEVANYLGVNDKVLDNLIKKTDIPYLKVDNRYIFHKTPLDAWLLNSANKYDLHN